MEIPFKLDNRFKFHREYRNALYQTLVYFKPEYCLEIGTNYGATARVFQTYFDEYMPKGCCITLDIKMYHQLNLKNVNQVIVHPWIDNIWDYHSGNNSELRQDVMKNKDIVELAMQSLGINRFDLFFIDGDHTEPSVRADWEMCTNLSSKPPAIIVLDDTDEPKHFSTQFAREIENKQEWNIISYDNWPCRVGMKTFVEK